MIVTIILLASIMLFKCIALVVSFFVPFGLGSSMFSALCMIPDLFFSMLLMPNASLDEFEVSQYKTTVEPSYQFDPYAAQDFVE